MADNSKIDWCDATWSPVVGCSKISDGCKFCYAERFTYRLACMGQKKYQKVISTDGGIWNKEIFCDESTLEQPLHWRKSRRIFVCSMSDLFHPKVPFSFTDKIFDMMYKCPQHTFLVLTKRPKQILSFVGEKGEYWFTLPNLHLGVSISNPDELWKVDELKKIPAAVRFLSIEPMLAGIEFIYDRLFCDRDPEEDSPVACVPCRCGKHWENSPIRGTTLNCIDWVVVGGESGPGARPMHPDWVRNIRDQCVAASVPFYFKQWGEWGIWEPIPNDPQKRLRIIGRPEPLSPKTILKIFPENDGCTIPFTGWAKVGKKKAGCLLDGQEFKQYPK